MGSVPRGREAIPNRFSRKLGALLPLLAVRAENAAHDQFVEFVAAAGRGDGDGGCGFQGGEVGLAERPFADEGVVFAFYLWRYRPENLTGPFVER